MNDKYIFETESSSEMALISSRHKIISVLDDIKNWRRELYKGYDNNIRYLCNGKLYTSTELEKTKKDLPQDEQGMLKDCKRVCLVDNIIDQIDDLLYEINYLLD